MDSKQMAPGTTVGTRYEIREVIGQGGFSTTYSAVDRQLLGHPCVVKELHLSHLTNDLAVTLFKREAEVLLKLDHKRIPKVHALIEEQGRMFLVQELVKGETLEARLNHGVTFPESRVREILAQMLDVLDYLHTHQPQVIHRDIKPANIIERDDGSIILIDFGAVRETAGGGTTAGMTGVYSPGYSPQEQYLGRASAASDIYALGATLLHLISGKNPADWYDEKTNKLNFSGRIPASPQLTHVLEGMVADLPGRLQTAAAVKQALTDTAVAPTAAMTSGAAAPDRTMLAKQREEPVVAAAPKKSAWSIWWPRLTVAAVAGLALLAVFKPEKQGVASDTSAVVTPPVKRTPQPDAGAVPQGTVDRKSASITPRQEDPPSRQPDPPRGATKASDSKPAPVKEAVADAGNGSATQPKTEPASNPAPAPTVPAVNPCAGIDRCVNAKRFTATLSYVSVSQVPYSSSIERNVKLTIRLRNLTDQPLALAYHANSGQLADNEGNRYRNETHGGESYVKGIGISSRDQANGEFVLDPGEERPIILDNFISLSNSVIFGVKYTYEVTIDELAITNGRARVVRGNAVAFEDITEPPRRGGDDADLGFGAAFAGRAQTGPNAGGPDALPGAFVSVGPQDDCDPPACFKASHFSARVSRLWRRQVVYSSSTEQMVKLAIRVQNTSDKEILLGYKSGSGQLTDDAGHRFRNEYNQGRGYVAGLQIVEDKPRPPVFTLAPGEVRDFVMDNFTSINKSDAVGTTFSYDMVLHELELTPSRQLNVTKTHAVSFTDLGESPWTNMKQNGWDTLSVNAGHFVAKLVNVASADTRYSSSMDHLVRLVIRLTNTTSEPLLLAYRDRSQQLSDDRATAYRNEAQGGRDFVNGIGVNSGDEANASFRLAPGESRDVEFRNTVNIPMEQKPGERMAWDLVLDEFERVPSGQLRITRSNALAFHDFRETPRGKGRMLMDALKPMIKKNP